MKRYRLNKIYEVEAEQCTYGQYVSKTLVDKFKGTDKSTVGYMVKLTGNRFEFAFKDDFENLYELFDENIDRLRAEREDLSNRIEKLNADINSLLSDKYNLFNSLSIINMMSIQMTAMIEYERILSLRIKYEEMDKTNNGYIQIKYIDK